jgi:DNA-directed RNA polymerase specialized sigma subunit
MKKCLQECVKNNTECLNEECRVWVDYEKDLNCCLLSIKKHGDLTLDETAKRLNLSIVRIKQLQDRAIQKLQKNRHLKGM